MLHQMLHQLFRTWFEWVDAWGYAGVFLLMAMESSVIPVPSEIVMPPAAFWAAQGRMTLLGVVMAGTAGSYFGSAVSYWVSRWLGRPLIQKYGRTFFLTPDKLDLAESWINQFGVFGIFLARLLPVIRHLVSIPAGIFEMKFVPFSISTLVGAGLWCGVLSWFGQEVIGSNPELIRSPEAMIAVIKAKMHWFLGGVLVFGLLYSVVLWFNRKRMTLTPTGRLKTSS